MPLSIVPPPLAMTESKDASPSITPMRPTPLTGNWCDLPWGEDGSSVVGTPAKIQLGIGSGVFASEAVTNNATEPVPCVGCAVEMNDGTSFILEPLRRADTAVPASEDADSGVDDLYLSTPADTWYPEEEAELPSVATEPTPVMTMTAPTAQAHVPLPTVVVDLPPRAAHFVDFKRLNCTAVAQPQRRVAQPVQYVPLHLTAPQGPRTPSSQWQVCRQPAAQPLPVPAEPRRTIVVLVSRFAPPPPPALETLHVLLKNGVPFEAYYQIVMRWYAKVSFALPKAHPCVPRCPPAEDYLYDFEGWVREIGAWWTKNFTRKQRPSKGSKA